MFSKCLTVSALVWSVCIVSVSAEEADAGAQPAPSLEELKHVVEPIFEASNPTEDQQNRAKGLMSGATWSTIVEGFEVKRGGEIFTSTHQKMQELVPTIMMPKMMAYKMKKAMAGREGRRAGPPTAKEIEEIRKNSKKLMRGKLSPELMGNLEELSEQRMKEILADKKVLVRVLGEKLSDVVLSEAQKPGFEKALSAAGYTRDLTHGPDEPLIKRMKTMLEKVTEEQFAALEKEK